MSPSPKKTAEYDPPPYPPPLRGTQPSNSNLNRPPYLRPQPISAEAQARRDAANQRRVDKWLQEQQRRAPEDRSSRLEEAVMATSICSTCGVRGHTKGTHRHQAGAAQGLPIRLKSALSADSRKFERTRRICCSYLTDFSCLG
jgi:hypothetical protein